MESDQQTLWVVIGGKQFSGAEKRLLHTAYLLVCTGKWDVRVRIGKELAFAGERTATHATIIEHLRDQGRLYEVGCEAGAGRFRKIGRLFWDSWSERARYRGCWVHVGLINPFFVPQVLRAERLFYEVTGPYQAKRFYWNMLTRVRVSQLCFVAVSPNVARILDNNLPKKVVKSGRVRLFVRNMPFVDLGASALKVSEKEKIVVFAHRLTAKKNPLLVAKAFVAIAPRHLDWDFRIYGQGILEREVREVVEQSGQSNVKFLGYCSDVKSVLERSLIFVSAISVSNYPSQSVFEALSNRNAILLADETGSDERLVSEENGLCVCITKTDIEKGLEKLCADEKLSEKANASIRFLSNKYSLESYTEEAGSLYEKGWE